jgi:hypothetical protein
LHFSPQKADKCGYSHLSSPIGPVTTCAAYKGRTHQYPKNTFSLANVKKAEGDAHPVILFETFEPQSPSFGGDKGHGPFRLSGWWDPGAIN